MKEHSLKFVDGEVVFIMKIIIHHESQRIWDDLEIRA